MTDVPVKCFWRTLTLIISAPLLRMNLRHLLAYTLLLQCFFFKTGLFCSAMITLKASLLFWGEAGGALWLRLRYLDNLPSQLTSQQDNVLNPITQQSCYGKPFTSEWPDILSIWLNRKTNGLNDFMNAVQIWFTIIRPWLELIKTWNVVIYFALSASVHCVYTFIYILWPNNGENQANTIAPSSKALNPKLLWGTLALK